MTDAPIRMPVVISEFPKSGGSWIVSMLGDALKVPCRDIYVRPGFDLFDAHKHPWYREADSLDFPAQCIIKSHELPGSSAFDFDVTQVHLVRDGRDVAVSKYFFEKDFCVKNGMASSFEEDFGAFIARAASEWAFYVTEWRNQSDVSTIKYESFLENPSRELGDLVELLVGRRLAEEELEQIVSRYSREKFSASLDSAFKYNTFVRTAASGDWKNHFSDENVAAFKAASGDALSAFGYALDDTWSAKNE